MKRDPSEILEDIFLDATKEINKDKGKSFLNSLSNQQKKWLFTIINKADSFKAILTVLVTSLTKKIENPNQDIRYHKVELKGGYSGRSFDTKYVTPFFKKRFKRLAMKESGWLTRSIEQPHPFTLNFPGKIRDKNVKEAFLQILNDIEKNKEDPRRYLTALFILLISQQTIEEKELNLFTLQEKPSMDIDLIIQCLISHFFKRYKVRGASKLPVIAIYSIYELLIKDVRRYQDKKLQPLRSHISPDLQAKRIGDIEIIDEKNQCFECVEIKHDIPIDSITVEDVYKKIKNMPIRRYYLLTTAQPEIKKRERRKIKTLVEKIKKEHGCEVIINGIISSLKYYLRLLKSPEEFLERYTNNLKLDFSKTAEIKLIHIKTWERILREEAGLILKLKDLKYSEKN
jgi:DNA (cytosine-5)-methyltransferase 1